MHHFENAQLPERYNFITPYVYSLSHSKLQEMVFTFCFVCDANLIRLRVGTSSRKDKHQPDCPFVLH